MDTFNDGTGIGCTDYKGTDCVATAKKRGVTQDKISELLLVCPFACGYCGKDTIVKECQDDSCQCKDTANYELVGNSFRLTCSAKTASACIHNVHRLGLTDDEVRKYFTNCAYSCEVCSPCAKILGVGDGICDPGNNNDKCFRYVGRDQTPSPRFDGGDCCNSGTDFSKLSDNFLRYGTCTQNSVLTPFLKKTCKCLTAPKAGEKDRRKDCAGGFGKWGGCSVTCEIGTEKRVFKVISPAQAGGQPCLHKDGYEDTRTCGRASDKCPSTTTTTTTTTTTAAPTSPIPTTLVIGNSGTGNNNQASGAATATATATAMMMAIACLTLLIV